MPFTLRVFFEGLSVFVPNTDESKGVRVLMIDARAPGLASNGDAQVSHIPSIRFRRSDLDPRVQQPKHRIEYSSEEAAPRGQWILNGDDLEIRIDGEPLPQAPLEVVRRHPTRDFALIPTMKVIYPEIGGVSVRDECLSKDLERLTDAGLVGRLRLQAGTLGVWDGDDGRYVSSDEFMFTGNPTLYRQRVASRTFFETTVEGESVEIYSRQRGHGLVFRAADGETVEIVVENQPPMDLMAAKPNDPEIDWDFELNYLIAKDAPKPLRLPIRATAAWARMQQDAAHGVAASAEAADCASACGPSTLMPSEEAVVLYNTPICIPVSLAPNEGATLAHYSQCIPAALSPSDEAAVQTNIPLCIPVIFPPNENATAASYAQCIPVIFPPHPFA